MTSRDKCTFNDCKEIPIQSAYNGKSYCREHYDSMLLNDFQTEWSRWKIGTQPHSRLLSLLGRMLEEKWTVRNGSLSKARLRDRGFNFVKSNNGLTFEITRHPNAMKDGYVSIRVVQKWEIKILEGIVDFLGERPWTKEDID